MEVIGRDGAKEQITKLLKSQKSELAVVLGRRRIGKTYLIRNILKQETIFHYTGLYQGTLDEHLERFAHTLSQSMNLPSALSQPKSWFHAFDMLREYIDSQKSKKKKVIFLDEFPWMATNRSRFLTAFTDFWNGFAANRSDLVVIICGSAASWMINKVLKNKGGLHNRVTERIFLEPFTLYETKLFLRKKNISLSDIDIIKLYMAVGGVPFYLDQVHKGESIVQAIDRICFAKNAVLRLEYNELMASLFDSSEKHQSIIDVLGEHPRGLQRKDLLDKTSLNSGGGTTSILHELETSGFIISEIPYGKKNKDKVFRLRDNYITFYHKYIKSTKPGTALWHKISTTPSYRSWSGLAFENVCIYHAEGIKRALKIDGILTTTEAWNSKGNDDMKGAQIDLLFDRADGIINICEIKFSEEPYIITSDYADKLRMKMASFRYFTKTKKVIFPTMITTYGLVENKHSNSFIQQDVTMKSLFYKPNDT